MKGGKKPTLDAKKVAKQWLEFWGKKTASIGDNWILRAVVMYYHVYYNLCKPVCIDNDLD